MQEACLLSSADPGAPAQEVLAQGGRTDQRAFLQEHGLFHLLPTHLLAEMCDEYASDTSFVFSVSKAHVSGGEWDLGKAAEAAQTRDWDNLLRYTATSLPDFVDHVVEAHEQRKAVCPHGILTLWEEANVPYCAPPLSTGLLAAVAQPAFNAGGRECACCMLYAA